MIYIPYRLVTGTVRSQQQKKSYVFCALISSFVIYLKYALSLVILLSLEMKRQKYNLSGNNTN